MILGNPGTDSDNRVIATIKPHHMDVPVLEQLRDVDHLEIFAGRKGKTRARFYKFQQRFEYSIVLVKGFDIAMTLSATAVHHGIGYASYLSRIITDTLLKERETMSMERRK